LTFPTKNAKIKTMQKICNSLLNDVIKISKSNPSSTLKECAEKAGYKSSTVYNWYTNLKTGKWPKDYNKTEDQKPLDPKIVDEFVSSFYFSNNIFKILRRLLKPNVLKDKYSIAKQSKTLKRMFNDYPNVDFWLYVDFGEPKDDLLLFLGKAKINLDKKFFEFQASDKYTEFKYEYKPEKITQRVKRKKNIWDFY
jgi:hypothetical protein